MAAANGIPQRDRKILAEIAKTGWSGTCVFSCCSSFGTLIALRGRLLSDELPVWMGRRNDHVQFHQYAFFLDGRTQCRIFAVRCAAGEQALKNSI